jgi:peptide/nickel transport system permease protein
LAILSWSAQARQASAVAARLYLLGADARGRDLLSRLLYGSRVSLTIGLVGVAITFVLGMLVGGISGYFGGRTDVVLMRACEMFMMIPGFYLMLALRSALPPEMSSVEVYVLLVAIMSFIGWAGFARVVRGMVLSIRNREYVLAAQASGASHLTIILRHVLPNTLSYAIVALTLSIPGYILGESALSLLGLGIQDPHASWGNLLKEAMDVAQIKFHPWILLPGLCIFVTVMAYNFLGDGLRDAFDPRGLTRGRG